MNLKKEVMVRGIKLLDIGFITAIYSIVGILLAKVCDRINGPFDKEKEDKKPTWRIIVEVILYLWVMGIVIYIVRNLIPLIPFPLDGVYGFKHILVKEVIHATMFSITFFLFQKHYKKKIEHLLTRL